MRTNLRVPAGGLMLDAWFYRPDQGTGPFPVVVMSHGLATLKAMGLDAFAQVFCDAGFACLVYDHRNFGSSEGEPRNELNPWAQVHDMRDVISYARNLPEVDPERLGLWGTSFSGGHVLVVSALDRR